MGMTQQEEISLREFMEQKMTDLEKLLDTKIGNIAACVDKVDHRVNTVWWAVGVVAIAVIGTFIGHVLGG